MSEIGASPILTIVNDPLGDLRGRSHFRDANGIEVFEKVFAVGGINPI